MCFKKDESDGCNKHKIAVDHADNYCQEQPHNWIDTIEDDVDGKNRYEPSGIKIFIHHFSSS